jgi:signal transduction histidine kinase
MGDRFMPHGMCYLWEPDLLWLHVVSDIATGAAYWAIPPTLLVLVVRARREVPGGAPYAARGLPHEWMFLMFGLFIVACGTTHFFAAWNVWNADYWASGGVKAVTALTSVATALALPPLVPRALRLIRDARESEFHRERLEEANRELAVLNAELRRLDEQRTRFFANISHELRTPLTLIQGPVEHRLETERDPELRSELELVRSNARLMERRVTDLLHLARSGDGEARPTYTRLDLAALVRDAVDRFSGIAAADGIDLRLDVPATLPIESDPDKVERVVENLVSNAIKFAPSAGAVRIRVEREAAGSETDRAAGAGGPAAVESADHVVVRVSDSGPGIAPEDRDRIFDRFHQLGGSGTAALGGSGLGLAIVQDFVHLLGGTVEVDADPDVGGARFTVKIPTLAPASATEVDGWRTEPAREAEGSRDRATSRDTAGRTDSVPGAVPEASAANETADTRVLVVEDVRDMRRFLARTLHPNHDVRVASGGEEALGMLDEWTPDLVLTDLMMPDMDGEALVAAIRARPDLADVPVLVLSARADDEMRIRLLRAGAQDYLTKPFAAEELRARVRNLVSMKQVRDVLRSQLQSATGDVGTLAVELKRHHDDLERALEETRRARDDAEAASQVKSQFLAVMSHELRTPLNAIIGYAELVLAGVAGGVNRTQEKHLNRIRAGAGQLATIIDDILVYSREGSEPRPVEAAPLDVGHLLKEIADSVAPAAEAKGLRMEWESPPGLTITTDRERLRRILTNLVSNGVKFTHEGSVRVTVERGADAVVFRVRDSGIGIRAEDRERIYDPFWQVDQSNTREAGGTGLGLSIVRRLVEQLGGTVDLDSRPGEGSTFTVRLPREPDSEANHTTGQRKST